MQTPHLQAVPSPPSDSSPFKEYRRTITEILADLSKPIPNKYLATRNQGGAILTYLPWFNCCKLLDRCAPGWQGEVKHLHTTSDGLWPAFDHRLFLTYRLSLYAQEGIFFREATGTELLKEEKALKADYGKTMRDEQGNALTTIGELAYGDPSSNAESMALRRTAAKFGLGLYLYSKE